MDRYGNRALFDGGELCEIGRCPMKNKRLTVWALLCAGFIAASSAQAAISPMPLDGSWMQLDQNGMFDGDFFTDTYVWNSADPILFTVTDIFVISDRFEVYDYGTLVLTTPAVPSWSDLGMPDPYNIPNYTLPYAEDPAVAYASGNYSAGQWLFAPGQHQITIRDIDIPLDVTGFDFPDGTVAFKANAVPDAAGTCQLLALASLALAFLRRRF
jgi:hypothetical protein